MNGLLTTSEKRSASPISCAAASPRSRKIVVLSLAVFLLILIAGTLRQGDRLCRAHYSRVPGLCGKNKDKAQPQHHAQEEPHHQTQAQNQNQTQPPRQGQNHTLAHDDDDDGGECAHFPDTSKVLVLLKTGASETYRRLPTHFMTMLKCLPADNVLIFSDMAETVTGHAVYDSLEFVLDGIKKTNADFEIYRRQKHCLIAHDECNKMYDVGSEGWNLDKYKNTHIAERAYQMRPHHDWYMFIDADTYVSFENLIKWLPHADPAKHHYIGSIEYSGTFPFAHGGSGYLMSQALMHSMLHGRKGFGNQYDEALTKHCCGDIMWSDIVQKEQKHPPENMWPFFNGRKPNTLSYSDKQWCQPVITLHKLVAQNINDVHALERELVKSGKELKIKDLFHRFFEPHLRALEPNWDNGSEDVFYAGPDVDPKARQNDEWWELPNRIRKDGLSDAEQAAHRSHEDCSKACDSFGDCFQYRYLDGVCGIGRVIRLGFATKKEDDAGKRVYSGWKVDRIRQWVKEHDECQQPTEWPVKDR
ncbi:hypothetical protein UVI_02007930 [Ustilaginoidea virens]|nr:hypothetical protein UVI_02007930 [Ustilaginoidea virens]